MVAASRHCPKHGRSGSVDSACSGRALAVGRVSPARKAGSRDPRLALSRKPLLRRNPAHRGPDPRTFVAAGFLPGGRQYRRRSRAAPIGRALDRRDADTRLIEYPGETGVGLQHLAILVGRHAHAAVWPEVISWLYAHG